MGVISILLGIIAFIGFTGGGAILANKIVELKASLAMALTDLANISDTAIMIGVIAVFAFIGLLICVNLVVNGLTYSKVSKMYKRLRRR